jgi:hypothetical protein
MARDNTVYDDRLVLLSEVDIFADPSPDEVEAIGKAAPMRIYEAGALLYSPHHLMGTSRETATKALGDFAEQGLVKLGRGKIFIMDRARLADEAGDQW